MQFNCSWTFSLPVVEVACISKWPSWWGVCNEGVCPEGVSAQQGVLARRSVCQGGCLPRGCPPGGVHLPPVDRILDTRWWKHYLSATSFADGNKRKYEIFAPTSNLITQREVFFRRGEWFFPRSILFIEWKDDNFWGKQK